MSTVTIYGIKNCDTMKKAFAWLDSKKIDYIFYDYKKQSVDETILQQAIDQHGWENVINRNGTTWRKLPPTVQNAMNEKKAKQIALEKPSIIKRPLLVKNNKSYLGFNPENYSKILA